jgi:hypothetical protein
VRAVRAGAEPPPLPDPPGRIHRVAVRVGSRVQLNPRRTSSAAATICAASGSMKRLVVMPAPRIASTTSWTLARWPTTSSPPSVVTSSRLSGTRQTLSGFRRRAKSVIAGVQGHFEVESGGRCAPAVRQTSRS